MPMQCNIERKGRLIRAGGGLLLLIAALVLVFTVPPAPLRRLAVVLLALGGIFGIFEGLRGWCAVRALGIRTRF